MAHPPPRRALCIFCCEIKQVEAREQEFHFKKVLHMNTAGMLLVHRLQEHITYHSDKEPTKEFLWARQIADKDKLQPVSVGVGPCNDCRSTGHKFYEPEISVEKMEYNKPAKESKKA